jgi:hypothetical protein
MANKSDHSTSYSISSSLKYGYDKKYVDKTNTCIDLIKMVMPIARKMLDIPPHIKVHFKPNRRANAYYSNYDCKVVIDPRRCKTYVEVIAALMHELVHAEQFKQGRLELTRTTMKWMGSPVVQETRNYEKYRAQPWEAEAFMREKLLCEAVARELRKKL